MRIFVISLLDPPQRRQSAVEKLRPTGMHFEIVDGVEARKWKEEELPIANDAWPGQPIGQIGCYMAHLRALRRLVDYGLNCACVFEDDFCFEPEPDITLKHLETTLPKDFHYVHLQRDIGTNPEYQIVERCGLYNRIHGTPLCAVAYVVTRPLAEYILQNHAQFKMPIDHLYSQLSYQGRFYALAKPLIGIQLGFQSNIEIR